MSIEQLDTLPPRQSFEHLGSDAAALELHIAVLNDARALLTAGYSRITSPEFQRALEADFLPTLVKRVEEGSGDLNRQYSEITEIGKFVSWQSAAARSDKDGNPVFFDENWSNVPASTIKIFGCFDGFQILTMPEIDHSMLFMRCNQGGLIHWSQITAKNFD
jgi:hypothetical protein